MPRCIDGVLVYNSFPHLQVLTMVLDCDNMKAMKKREAPKSISFQAYNTAKQALKRSKKREKQMKPLIRQLWYLISQAPNGEK